MWPQKHRIYFSNVFFNLFFPKKEANTLFGNKGCHRQTVSFVAGNMWKSGSNCKTLTRKQADPNVVTVAQCYTTPNQ